MPDQPSTWPLSAPGFYLGYLPGGLMLTLMGEQCTNASFDLYMKEIQAGIDLMRTGDNVKSIHVLGAPLFWTKATMLERVSRLRSLASLSDRNKAKLAAAFQFEVIVPLHSVARISIRTLMSLTRMPYPSATEATVDRAVSKLSRVAQPPEVARWRVQIAEIVARVSPDLGAPAEERESV